MGGGGREGNRNGDGRGKRGGNRDRRGKGNRNSGGRMGRAAPFRGQGREGVRRKMGGFEAVDGNGIRTGTKLKDKGTRGTAKDLVRTRVGWGERGVRGRSTDKDKRRM
jgi:hypothetical protein